MSTVSELFRIITYVGRRSPPDSDLEDCCQRGAGREPLGYQIVQGVKLDQYRTAAAIEPNVGILRRQ